MSVEIHVLYILLLLSWDTLSRIVTAYRLSDPGSILGRDSNFNLVV